MAQLGHFLSCEEFTPSEHVWQAQRAEKAGFKSAWISDHFHPWNDEQGQSSFVWSVIGAVGAVTEELRVHTAVTCPMIRIHPAIIAQAAATSAVLLGPGRFGLGVGTGEKLNESIFADPWPTATKRQEMLEEAVALIRHLWEGGFRRWDGEHYVVDQARIYTLPDELPPIHVSAFGPKAADMAARIGDGLMTVGPEQELLDLYRGKGGRGTSHTALKVCWGEDTEACVKTAHRIWPNEGLPGQLAQELPSPAHFEQAAELVTLDHIRESVPCGPDPETHIKAIQEHVDAGFDEVYVQQIGPDQEGFFAFYEREVLPHFS